MMRRFLTLALIGSQTAVFALATRTLLFSCVLLLISLLGASGIVRYPLGTKWKRLILAGLGIGFFIRYMAWPFWAPMHQVVFPRNDYAAMHAIAAG